MTFEAAERIADAVLYEGYLLYPYRASSAKNQVRWQFGVVAPRGAVEKDGSDPWLMQTECLIALDGALPATVDLRIRYLHLQGRVLEEATDAGTFRPVDRLEIDGEPVLSWEEAIEERHDFQGLSMDALLRRPEARPLEAAAGTDHEDLRRADGTLAGRFVRTRWPISARLTMAAQAVDGLIRLRLRIENESRWPDEPSAPGVHVDRNIIMRRAMLGAHTLISCHGGRFVSLTDPPPAARQAARDCENLHTWPVLVGHESGPDLILSSPIILPDHPEIAPESPTDLFDATEIDEILTLRILTLTDEEKREARATDPRARRILDRSEEIPPEVFERLHGAIRSMSGPAENGGGADGSPATENGAHDRHAAETGPTDFGPAQMDGPELPPTEPVGSWADDPSAPFWEPEARVPPDQASVQIAGQSVGKGSRVRLRPAPHRDTMDMFLADKVGLVTGVFESVDDEIFVALTVEDDPARDLHDWYGRYLYFRPDELEPLADRVASDA